MGSLSVKPGNGEVFSLQYSVLNIQFLIAILIVILIGP